MAITCRRCGAGYDVTLFQFEHRVRCDCGAWVDLAGGHVLDQGVMYCDDQNQALLSDLLRLSSRIGSLERGAGWRSLRLPDAQ